MDGSASFFEQALGAAAKAALRERLTTKSRAMATGAADDEPATVLISPNNSVASSRIFPFLAVRVMPLSLPLHPSPRKIGNELSTT